MALYTVAALMADFLDLLRERYEIEPTIRYFRAEDVAELPTAPAYYIEPGTLTLNRLNVGSPQAVQTIRLLSEFRVDYANAAEELETTRAFFEKVARDLLREPRAIENAFFQSAQTFADAPSGFSVSVLEDGVSAIYGGVEFTFSLG